MFNVSKEKATSCMMSMLVELYIKQSTSNRLFLIKKLFNLMIDDSSMVNHLNEFNELSIQLKSLECVFTNDIKAFMFICSLLDMDMSKLVVVINKMLPILLLHLMLLWVLSCMMSWEKRGWVRACLLQVLLYQLVIVGARKGVEV